MLDLKVARVTRGGRRPTPFTSGGAQVLGLIIKDLPTDSADEAETLLAGVDAAADATGVNWSQSSQMEKATL